MLKQYSGFGLASIPGLAMIGSEYYIASQLRTKMLAVVPSALRLLLEEAWYAQTSGLDAFQNLILVNDESHLSHKKSVMLRVRILHQVQLTKDRHSQSHLLPSAAETFVGFKADTA